MLEDVRALVEDEEAKTRIRLPALTDLLNKPEGLSRCLSELEGLKAKLERNGGHSDRMQMLTWPLKEGDVKKALDNLGRFQQFLGLTLDVDQTCVPSVSHKIGPDHLDRRLMLEIHDDTSVAKQDRKSMCNLYDGGPILNFLIDFIYAEEHHWKVYAC